MSASLAGNGVPPICGGPLIGHTDSGFAGSHGTGAPASHRDLSEFPLLSRGVWHCPHMATPSTTYFPRATEPPLVFLPGCCGLASARA